LKNKNVFFYFEKNALVCCYAGVVVENSEVVGLDPCHSGFACADPTTVNFVHQVGDGDGTPPDEVPI
jgi:hypothetical protein